MPAEPRRAPPIAPLSDPSKGGKARGALAALVGAAVAVALGVAIPQEESGRKVEASIGEQGELKTRHIAGRQYLDVYLDMVGVATACDGITTYQGKPLKKGEHFTEEQCTEMLEAELLKHAQGVMRCSPGLARSTDPALERKREGPRFAAISLAYNVGVGNYCASTADKRFDAGLYPAGCEALTRWNRAGGRVVKGLVARRAREAKICHDGLAPNVPEGEG